MGLVDLVEFSSRHGLDQQGLARIFGVTQSAVSRWLSEERSPTAKTQRYILSRMAELDGVPTATSGVPGEATGTTVEALAAASALLEGAARDVLRASAILRGIGRGPFEEQYSTPGPASPG